jgi:hypothetical protein
VYLVVWVLALWIGPLVLTPLWVALGGDAGAAVSALSLPVGAWEGFFGWEEFRQETTNRDREAWVLTRSVAALAGVAYLTGAAVFWLDAVRRFGAERK